MTLPSCWILASKKIPDMGRVVYFTAETIWKCGGRVTSPILCLCWCWATCLLSPFSYIIGKGKEEAGRPIQIWTPGSLLPNAESEPKNFECSTFKTDTQSLKFLLRGVLCTPWGVGIFKLKIWISWRNRNFVKKHLKLQYLSRAQLEKWGSKISWHTPVKNLKYFDTHS